MKWAMYGELSAAQKKALQKRLRIGLASVFLLFCLVISTFGGNGTVPTWDDIYRWAEIAPSPRSVPPEAGDTQVHFIDVGQGDAVLIQQGDHFALIDAGPNEAKENLLMYLRQKEVEQLELLVMTHPDSDHIGAMDDVIAEFPVQELWIPDFSKAVTPTGDSYQEILDCADVCGTKIVVPAEKTAFPLGDGTITLIGDGVVQSGKEQGYNDLSLCTMFQMGDFSFLDTGDAEAEAEEKMLSKGYPLQADVFKAGHHGSSSSNTAEFLQAVHPKIVVASCGWNNLYGHPHSIAMENFAAIGAEFYETDLYGDIIVVADQYGDPTVYTERKKPRYRP